MDTNGEAALTRPTAALTLLGLVLLCALAWWYTHAGEPLLRRLDASVGEVLLEEGRRFEAAGAWAAAKDRYAAALRAHFAGAQNRAQAEKQLGSLLLAEGDAAAALPHLEAATAGPQPVLSAFGPRCEALLALNRADELPQVLAAWRAAAGSALPPAQQADLAYYTGKAALAAGRRDEARGAFAEGAALDPGSRCANELAAMLFEAGDLARMNAVVEAYLATGASGPRADWMRGLRAKAAELAAGGT